MIVTEVGVDPKITALVYVAARARTSQIAAVTSVVDPYAEYRACVDANGRRAKACEARRLAMEAEERAYFNRSSGTQGGTSASNVNIQSR
jgi:hypothetical protein